MAKSLDDIDSHWISRGLVVVKYPRGDPIGMFYGYFSLLVYEVQAVYITLFLANRDLLSFYCFFSHFLSEILNYLVKDFLKHPRPDGGPPSGGLFEGRYGMPSQHCHCFAYIYTMVHLIVFHYYRKHINIDKKILVSLISNILLGLQIHARIYLKFHTLNQCLIGIAFGSLSSVMFYLIGIKYFMPKANFLCSLWPLKWLSFRKDLVSEIPHLSRQSKQVSKLKSR